MNTELPDCTKCQKPKSMQKAKGKQRNTRNKEQPIDLDPAKAWIKNLGAGTTKEMPKLKTKRDKTLMMVTTFPTTHTPSTPVSTSTAKNKSVTVSKTNGMQLALSSDVEKCNSVGKIMDSTMVSIQQINDAEVDEPAKSSEQAIGNVTSDDDSMNYQTCIELDTTLINVNETKTETIDTEPISSTAPAQSKTNPILTKSKMMDFKTNQSFKHFPLELNTILENETSLYEPMGTIEWMNARMKDPEKLSQELELVKREWNEHLDDTIINETLPHELDISIKPSTAHELSIPLASFDWIPFPASFALSPTVLHDTKLTDTLSSLPLNSTTLPTDTFAELDKAKQNLREMGSFKRKSVFIKSIVHQSYECVSSLHTLKLRGDSFQSLDIVLNLINF